MNNYAIKRKGEQEYLATSLDGIGLTKNIKDADQFDTMEDAQSWVVWAMQHEKMPTGEFVIVTV